MGTPITHVWVTRAYCPSCQQYLWTNPGSGNIFCRCSESEILDHVIITGDEVTSSYDFRQAVVADLGVDSADLDLTHGTP